IRQWRDVARATRSVEIGKPVSEREFNTYRFDRRKHQGDGTRLLAVLHELGCASVDDFYAAVGYGKIAPRALIQKLDPQARVHETAEGPIAHAVKKALGMSGRKVTVRGLDDALISLARCCNPIRREPIVGYITRGRGVTVHRERCPKLEKPL